jgi:hypothetical protein
MVLRSFCIALGPSNCFNRLLVLLQFWQSAMVRYKGRSVNWKKISFLMCANYALSSARW